jgi:thiol-disulfide isomerase/thioredoxin
MRSLAVLFLIFLVSFLHAQENVSFHIRNAPVNTRLILEYFMEDGWKNLDGKELDAQGKLMLQVNFDHPGQYRIRLSSDPEKWGDFLINPEMVGTPKLTIETEYKLLRKLPLMIVQNPESEPYSKLMPAYHRLTLNPDTLSRSGLAYLERERNFFQLCDSIATAYPNTYTGKFLTKLLGAPISPAWQSSPISPDSILAYNAKHQFDFVPFRDKNIIYHIGTIRKLNLHFDFFKTRNQEIVYIDQIMTKGLADETVSAWLFRFMLDKLIDNKNEEALTYFLTWYSSDCQENDHTTAETKKLLSALEHCKPGNVIEFLNLPDVNGQHISMKDVFAKNKVTIIMFWKTNCSHCREFKPELKKLYEKYHAQGVEVYAIATDKNQTDWQPVAKSDDVPWINVYLESAARQNFNSRFPVPSTPTLMAVDKNGVILKRMVQRSNLEAILIDLLEEVK